MSNQSLAVYLRDHYAGGVGALELLERLSKGKDAELASFFEKLRADVQADHQELHQIMTALQIDESAMRDAGAWIAEKFSRAKLGLGAPTTGVALLQAFEVLVVGIIGKRMLWRALRAISLPALARFDFGRLELRATEQLERVEEQRLAIAPQALATG